jgi:hypothetical protein
MCANAELVIVGYPDDLNLCQKQFPFLERPSLLIEWEVLWPPASDLLCISAGAYSER